MGCWTPVESFTSAAKGVSASPEWQSHNANADGSEFEIFCNGQSEGKVQWPLIGNHNIENALAAVAAARHAGVPVEQSIEALKEFRNVKRRLELRADTGGIRLYDDFAHHPTAIATTLDGLRGKVDGERIIALLEPRSNTMRMGVHSSTLADSLSKADMVLLFQPEDIDWDLKKVAQSINGQTRIFSNVDEMVGAVKEAIKSGDHILVMSNGAFGGIHEKLIKVLDERQP
jgi:UDP-N-acetylmuramate: L-alanyl-gamma-D-glutamyl-meso-diaminopimelate ligase